MRDRDRFHLALLGCLIFIVALMLLLMYAGGR